MEYNTLQKDKIPTMSRIAIYLLQQVSMIADKYMDYFYGEEIAFDCSEVCVSESPHFGKHRYAMMMSYSSSDQTCYEFVLYMNGDRIASVAMNRYSFFSTDGLTLNICESSIDCGYVAKDASTYRYEYMEVEDEEDESNVLIRLPNKELTEEAYFQLSLLNSIVPEREDLNTALSLCHSLPDNYMLDVYYGYKENIFEYLDQYAIHKSLQQGLENIVQERLHGKDDSSR